MGDRNGNGQSRRQDFAPDSQPILVGGVGLAVIVALGVSVCVAVWDGIGIGEAVELGVI